MKFVPMLQLLQRAVSEGYGVPSFCVWNAESIEVVLRVAAELEGAGDSDERPRRVRISLPRVTWAQWRTLWRNALM